MAAITDIMNANCIHTMSTNMSAARTAATATHIMIDITSLIAMVKIMKSTVITPFPAVINATTTTSTIATVATNAIAASNTINTNIAIAAGAVPTITNFHVCDMSAADMSDTAATTNTILGLRLRQQRRLR